MNYNKCFHEELINILNNYLDSKARILSLKHLFVSQEQQAGESKMIEQKIWKGFHEIYEWES